MKGVHWQVNAVSARSIMEAKEKPKGVSAVRWRIELSRRRMVRRLGKKEMDFMPNPDTLW